MKKMRRNHAASACPCGSGLPYSGCCEALHLGSAAPTAEALMRSRYSAYVFGLERYLLDTWHASTRPAALNLRQDLPLQWLGLEVRFNIAGKMGDVEGSVEFVARHKVNGKAERLHEVSRFAKVDGRWFYVDGELRGASTDPR